MRPTLVDTHASKRDFRHTAGSIPAKSRFDLHRTIKRVLDRILGNHQHGTGL